MVVEYDGYNNVINYSFIDYIIKSYVPELLVDINKESKKIKMGIFREAMLHNTTKHNINDKSYERLEYLGDAIFHMIITEYFYKRYDEEGEGFLTRLRIRIERGDSMAELTQNLELESYIQVYGICLNDHIFEDVFEAFIGAFFLNFGMSYTRIFIIRLVERHKDLSAIISNDDNYKDLLLRYFHQMKWGHPVYHEETSNSGKFISIVRNPFNKIIGRGSASSKKKAEQFASKKALEMLNVIVNDEIDSDWLNKIEKVEKEIDKKIKKNKKAMSVYNPNNKLMKKKDIVELLKNYNVRLGGTEIILPTFHEAMTHRSYINRKKLISDDKIMSKKCVKLQKKSNERLQFLGDSIIHFVIGEFLFNKYPKANEGFLTRLRCKLENRESLFYLAKKTKIDSYLLVSQNIEILHGRNNINIIGGGFEAFVGAMYLEIGPGPTKQFVLEVMRIELDIDAIAENETNYKELILQLYNSRNWGHPEYKIIKEEGPDHSKIFTMGIYLNNKLMGKGKASSKKKAEQIASKNMYSKYLNDLE